MYSKLLSEQNKNVKHKASDKKKVGVSCYTSKDNFQK